MNRGKAQTPDTRERIWYLDILRVFLVFTVVVLHINPIIQLNLDPSSVVWKIMNAYSALFRWNVPVFFMISGALFLSPKREITTARLYGKTMLRMVVSFFFWSAFYALVHCLIEGKGKWTLINQLLRGHYHMWYVLAIISLYWVTPLLREITKSRKATEYLLLTGFVFSFLFARLLGFVRLFDLPHADVLDSVQSTYAQMNPYRSLSPLFYYMLGHYLSEYEICIRLRRLILAAGAAGLLLTVVLSDWHSGMIGTTSAHFYDTASLNVLAAAAAVFTLFKCLFFSYKPKGKAAVVIAHASACTYGIYLIHAFIIERLNIDFGASVMGALLGIPAAAVVVFVLAYGICAVFRLIPAARRYLL